MTPQQALIEAKRIAGNGLRLSRVVGRSHQAVYRWTVVPPECVLAVEKATGVSRHLLRPDVFGPPDDDAA